MKQGPRDIPSYKSFKRDILRGYLENIAFVFIDLARKRNNWVYTLYKKVYMQKSNV
jgi:hypothetical protein